MHYLKGAREHRPPQGSHEFGNFWVIMICNICLFANCFNVERRLKKLCSLFSTFIETYKYAVSRRLLKTCNLYPKSYFTYLPNILFTLENHCTRSVQSLCGGCSRRVHKIVYPAVKKGHIW